MPSLRALLCACVLSVCFNVYVVSAAGNYTYGAIIDAGSSGSRFAVYRCVRVCLSHSLRYFHPLFFPPFFPSLCLCLSGVQVDRARCVLVSVQQCMCVCLCDFLCLRRCASLWCPFWPQISTPCRRR